MTASASVYSYVAEEAAYRERNPRSAARFAEAQQVLAGGNSRLTAFFKPFPFYAEHGAGCVLRDVDGNERLDFYNHATSLIPGHRDPQITAALQAQAEKGTAFANPTEPEVELAALLTAAVPSLQQLRFTNSGTGGVALALRAARAFTGKSKIAKIEGAYHGTSDHASVSVTLRVSAAGDETAPRPVPSSQGLTAKTLDDVIIIPGGQAA